MIRPSSVAQSNMSTLISIGRQFGSGGKAVADVIGQKLGIKVYDNELILRAAQESGLSEGFFARKDENRSLFTLPGVISFGRFASADNILSENELFHIQSDAIQRIAAEGPAIFIGRCSDYVLRDTDCLSVFLSAPLPQRIERVSKRLNINANDAESLIKKKDRSRETYYNYFTFGNWGVASNYDLCLDTALLGIGGTADAIIQVAKLKGLCE